MYPKGYGTKSYLAGSISQLAILYYPFQRLLLIVILLFVVFR